jgi:signal transduction histidine kinase
MKPPPSRPATPPALNADALIEIAHDMRNPLNAISAALLVLNRMPADAPRAERAREVIARQIEQLSAAIGRLEAHAPPAPPDAG